MKLVGYKLRSDLSTKSNTDYIVSRAWKRMWIIRRLKAARATELELLKVPLYAQFCELTALHLGLSSPRGAWAFHELRRYDTRPLQLNWGPENVYFRKTRFWDPNINVMI